MLNVISGISLYRRSLYREYRYIEDRYIGVPLYNGLDFNAFVIFVLACGDVFLYGGIFTIEMFSYTVVYETCSAPDVVLIAIVTGDLVNGIPEKAQFGFGGGAVVPCVYTLRGVVRESSFEGV